MNVLFLSLEVFDSIYAKDMYTDILRVFCKKGHKVYSVSPLEKRTQKKTELIKEENSTLLRLEIGNIQKTNLIEKGISTLTIQNLYIAGIKKYFEGVKFDLVLYATPPITFYKVIKYIKTRDNAFTYLMLKDIFPQNAVDLGMFSKKGVSGLIYRYFRKQEVLLYKISDYIGCMSEANADYVLKHNSFIDRDKVGISPNVLDPCDRSASEKERFEIREKYGIPQDKKIFVYGGNLGRPQAIEHVIACLEKESNREDIFFLIVGDGTEFGKLEAYYNSQKDKNMKLMKRLPREDYDKMIGSCDVGMIFLDHRFTIPNFPSRLLAYMQAKLPVLACTDPNTDVGKVIENGNFGVWCESDDVNNFSKAVDRLCNENLKTMGENGFAYMNTHYTAEVAYKTIVDNIK